MSVSAGRIMMRKGVYCMISQKDLLAQLSKYVFDLYFIQHDVQEVCNFFSESITWVGIEESEEYLNREEVFQVLRRKIELLDGAFHILKEHYVVNKMSLDAYVAIINIKVSYANEVSLVKECDVHITLVWHREHDGWKIHHIHNSIPASTNKNQKSNVAYYYEGMQIQSYINSDLLAKAPKAIEEKQFYCYIQPQLELKSGEVIGGEVLVRWVLEDGTVRMPNEFIPLFEEQGFITNFDFYMLETLCEKMQLWLREGISILPLSINQSRLHMQEDNYVDRFCAIVDKFEIPHHFIVFELTESGYVENNEKITMIAKQLHQKGFQIAIDDFGTGYASLNLLSIVEADILKVDKSLLDACEENEKASLVLQEIISLAHKMKMRVVCEGIETLRQKEFLVSMGCDIGQGYLFTKPIEAQQFAEAWLCKKNENGRKGDGVE